MGVAIEIKGLEKSYGAGKVLKGISFSVMEGEIFALLGTNGAGKTTTLECMEGLRKYDGGTIRVQGKCGVQLQSSSLPDYMKAAEALHYFAKWQGAGVKKEQLSRLGLDSFLNKQYCQLSTGQKRRLHLAIALLGDPDILVLDEPTAGLDVEGRAGIHGEIRALKAQGKTIILASHDMAEVEELCDRLAILRGGEIAFLGTAAALTENVQNESVILVRFSQPAQEGYCRYETRCIEDTLMEIAAQAKARGVHIRDLRVEQAGLEQRFLEIAKEADA